MDKNLEINLSLIELRRLKNLSQENIAKQLSISSSGYRKKEKKLSAFTIPELKILCKIFDKNYDDMIKIIDN